MIDWIFEWAKIGLAAGAICLLIAFVAVLMGKK